MRAVSVEEVRGWAETRDTECKASLDLKDDVKSLTAMMNAAPGFGRVVFGVGTDGSIIGLDGNTDTMQRKLADHI